MATRRQEGSVKIWKASPGAGEYGFTPSTLADTAAWQGEKGDLGATFADLWRVDVEVETGTTPTDGDTADVYWAPSGSATAGTDNPGGTSGADATYTGHSGGDLAAGLKQLMFIGSVPVDNINGTQQASFLFSPPSRYGMPVIVNETGAAFDAGTNITLTELKIVSD